jgi:hypothetical protein
MFYCRYRHNMFLSLKSRAIFVVAISFLLMKASPGQAGVAVLTNPSGAPVRFSVTNPEGKVQQYVLNNADLVPIPVADKVSMTFESDGKPQNFTLQPDSLYFFITDDKSLVFRKFELPAPPNEEPNSPPPKPRYVEPGIYTITVKFLVDDDQPAVRSIWEKELRERIAEASKIFERHCGVRFEVKAIDTWETSNDITDFEKTLREYETKVSPAPAHVAIGFTSQYAIPHGMTHLGGTRGPLYPYVLIREWSQHVTQSERLEILVHELGHFLGASHSADPYSVMRPQLGDRRSHSVNFRIGFDPLNTLAMNLLADQLRAQTYRGFSQMPLDTRRELQRIYLLLGKDLPKDPAAEHYVEMLGIPVKVAKPVIEKPSDLVAATQEVVQAVTDAARVNKQAITSLKGDGMTEYLIRRAAAAAAKQPLHVARKAFLLGIGIALDDSNLWCDLPGINAFYRQVETEDARQIRLSYLDKTTLLKRHDTARHFLVSCALVAYIGPAGAEQAGIVKEIADARGDSGFSFVDLSADLAGIVFASRIHEGIIPLDKLANSFKIQDFVPNAEDLKEGLSWDQFTKDYGSVGDNRFKIVRGDILKRIQSLPGYK